MPKTKKQTSARGLNLPPHLYVWFQWVLANAIGEMVGLTGVVSIASRMGPGNGAANAVRIDPVSTIGLIVVGVLGAGLVVGMAQWLVLRELIPAMTVQMWAGVTAIGAAVATVLGGAAGLLMSMANTGTRPAFAFGDLASLALVALLGVLIGMSFGIAQWSRLRRYVRRAGWWIAVHAGAWMLGMILVYIDVNLVASGGAALEAFIFNLQTAVAVGGLVGALSGIVLVRVLVPLPNA